MSFWTQYTHIGASQAVLPEHYTPLLVISTEKSTKSLPPSRILSNSLVIPFYAASASASILLLHLLFSLYSCQALGRYLCCRLSRSRQAPVTTPDETLDWANGQPLISQLGGPVIYAFKVARLFGCLAFLGLALVTPSTEIIATAVYVSVLGLLSVTTTYKYASLASQHLATVLLVVFSVFAYRDLFPLLTFNEQPEDVHEGWLLWAKLAVLTTITLLPAVVPRQYVPVDPKNPSEFPHPEQTASWLSMSLYLWLDPIIFMAQRVSHLSHDMLPLLQITIYLGT
ncbi:hypothetical protein BU15DRAFT_71865 [Melanogaster broomeanus]|nr:hypothetical protein BU15DRAFT_71865 [Melanogaster broomeanus]